MSSLEFRGDKTKILWDSKSPYEGEPTCLCCYCGALIPQDAIALRLFDTARNLEARFCDECQNTCFGLTDPGGAS